MVRKMTVVFHDEELYKSLKIEAIKRNSTSSDIISRAVIEWLENQEDIALLPAVEQARAEWKQKGGRSWSDVEKDLTVAVNNRKSSKE
jgi:hypothetical protein